jgi:hypothetical protein
MVKENLVESAAMALGWDETALYHVVAVTALFNLMNRLVEGMSIEPDPAYVRPTSERLASGGTFRSST